MSSEYLTALSTITLAQKNTLQSYIYQKALEISLVLVIVT